MRFDMMVKQREHLKLVLDTQPGIFWVQAVREKRLYYLSSAARNRLHHIVPREEEKDCFCLVTLSHRACLHCALYKRPAPCPVLTRLASFVKTAHLCGKVIEWNPGEPTVFYYGGTEEG